MRHISTRYRARRTNARIRPASVRVVENSDGPGSLPMKQRGFRNVIPLSTSFVPVTCTSRALVVSRIFFRLRSSMPPPGITTIRSPACVTRSRNRSIPRTTRPAARRPPRPRLRCRSNRRRLQRVLHRTSLVRSPAGQNGWRRQGGPPRARNEVSTRGFARSLTLWGHGIGLTKGNVARPVTGPVPAASVSSPSQSTPTGRRSPRRRCRS